MKKIISFLIVVVTISFCFSVKSQKLNKENVGTYKYVQLPINTILTSSETYRVEAMGQYSDAHRRDAIIRHAYVSGFKKVGEGMDCDFIVKIEEYPLQYGERKRETSVKKVKKDGVEKSYTYYSYTQDIGFKYVLKIFNKNGEKIYGKTHDGSDRISGGESTSSSDALKSFSSAQSKFNKEVTGDAVSYLCRITSNEVGYPVKNLYLRTAKIKAKKYKYDEYDSSFELFLKGIEVVLNDEEKAEEASEYFLPAIETWEKMLTEADMDNKKARINKKIASILYLNIALSQLMMKEYDKSIATFEKGSEINKNIGSMDSGFRVVKERKRRLEANLNANNGQ